MPQPTAPRRRDRRGRGRRGPLAWPPVPAMTSRAAAFDELVLDSASRLGPHLVGRWANTEFAVEEVPAHAGWEGEVVLARAFAPRGQRPARVVVYRRPVELRAQDPAELPMLVHAVVVDQVAALLGVAPSDLDPRA